MDRFERKDYRLINVKTGEVLRLTGDPDHAVMRLCAYKFDFWREQDAVMLKKD
jgi:hypothetical protein